MKIPYRILACFMAYKILIVFSSWARNYTCTRFNRNISPYIVGYITKYDKLVIQNTKLSGYLQLKNYAAISHGDHMIPSKQARPIMNFGSQLIYLIFLARQQKAMLITTWHSTMSEKITVPVFLIITMISISLPASASL